MLQTWFELHNLQPLDEEAMRGECIWDNVLVSSPRHRLKRDQWRRWAEAGITLINHLCHPTKDRVLGHLELCDRYQINCNFLQALTVRHSIPHSWRQMLTAGFSRPISPKFTFEINGTRFGILNSSPKGWYRKLVGKCASPFSRGSSWRTELDVQTEPEWEKYGHYHTQFPGKLNCNLLPI